MAWPGREIQKYGPKGGYAVLDGQHYPIRAAIHTLGGYSAHADRKDLLNFIGRMRYPPRQVRLVYGDAGAKQALAAAMRQLHPDIDVTVPRAPNTARRIGLLQRFSFDREDTDTPSWTRLVGR